MDLLGDYGLGSDSEPGSPTAAGTRGASTGFASNSPLQAAPSSGAQPLPEPSHLLSRLPAPSGAKALLLSGLPSTPAAKKKVVVQFRVPISYDPADVKGGVEEDPARKRQKASSRGRSLSELLPAPKNTAVGGGRRLDVLGGTGVAGATAAGAKAGIKYDSDNDEIVPGTEDPSGMVDLAPGDAVVDGGNEAFTIDAIPVAGTRHAAGAMAASAAAVQQYDVPQQEQCAAWQAYYQRYDGHEYSQHQQAAAAAVAATAVDPAEAMLVAAMAAEWERTARRGQGGGMPAGIQIKEVRADQLKYMDAGQRAGVDAIRNALGADYEAKLRAEAGSEPAKLAKRRHQIGSLYHYAKQKELEQLEVRAAGSKTKAETQRKYGW